MSLSIPTNRATVAALNADELDALDVALCGGGLRRKPSGAGRFLHQAPHPGRFTRPGLRVHAHSFLPERGT